MKRIAALLVVAAVAAFVAAAPAQAAEPRYTLRAGLGWTTSGSGSSGAQEATFDDAFGLSAGLEVRLRPWVGLQAGIGFSKVKVEQDGVTANTKTDLVPVTLAALFRPLPSSGGEVDFYVGPQVGYVNYGNVPSDVSSLKSEVAWGARAGVSIYKKDSKWGFNLDVSYLKTKTKLESTGLDTVELRWDPLTVSAGVAFRF